MARKLEKMIVRNADIEYPNFAGKASKYNAAGCRNFNLVFSDLELVRKMQEDHWNMKPCKDSLNPETGEYMKYYTSVDVEFDNPWYPDPQIRFVSEGGRKQTILTEELLNEESEICPDKLYFDRIDVTIRLNRSINKTTGQPQTKGKLFTMCAWVEEDELRREYDDLLYGNEGVDPQDDEVPFDED